MRSGVRGSTRCTVWRALQPAEKSLRRNSKQKLHISSSRSLSALAFKSFVIQSTNMATKIVCLRIRIGLDGQIGPGSRTHKNNKKLLNLIFCSTGCSTLRDEGFPCSLDVLYGGPGICKLQFWIKKIRIQIHLKCWIRIRIL